MTARRLRLQHHIALQTAAAIPKRAAEPHLISDVRTYPVREPVSRRAWTVVRVRTTSGLTGWGEAVGGVNAAELESVGSLLHNRPATAWAVTMRLPAGSTLAGAIDMALLDISARAVNAPVFRLLGGPTRFKARALTTLSGDSDADLATSLEQGVAAGYRAFQVPLPRSTARNQGQAFHQAVRGRFESLRTAAPNGVDFVAGGSGEAALTAGDAAGIAAALERFHVLWFDEPAAVANLKTLRKIADESVTPLGLGRTVREVPMYQDLLREGAVDILRPPLHEHGLSSIRKVAALAETYYVAVAPHHEGGPIATAAALQLAAALPNFFIQHVPLPAAEPDRAMRASLIRQPVEVVRDGFLTLTNAPGLGIDVNEDALTRYKDQA